MRKVILSTILFLFSVGWLLPLSLARSAMQTWLITEVAPKIAGKLPQLNSFPLLDFSQQTSEIALWWLLFVVFFWAFVGVHSLAKSL
jgi:hypothetical protein